MHPGGTGRGAAKGTDEGWRNQVDLSDLDLGRLQGSCRDLADASSSPQMARVAAWLVDHVTEVAWHTVDDVARETDASPATVVRTLQRLGFTGYSDLQARVRARLPGSELVWKLTRSEPAAPGLVGMTQIIDQEQSNLLQLSSAVGPALPVLVPLLTEAHRIFVTAALTTVPLAQHLAMHLNLLLDNVRFMEAGTADGFSLISTLREGDVLIGLSFARYARATLETLSLAAQTQDVVVLTDRRGPDIPGARMVLRLPSGSRVHFSSSVTFVTLTMVLARLLHEAAPTRVEANLARVDHALSDLGLLQHEHNPARARPPDRLRTPGPDGPGT